MSGHECPVWEPQFLSAVENQIDVFCENMYSDWSVYYNHTCTYQHQMTHDMMMMLSSDVMPYHIFVSEWFCLHMLGLWLGVLIDYVFLCGMNFYGRICGNEICKFVTL